MRANSRWIAIIFIIAILVELVPNLQTNKPVKQQFTDLIVQKHDQGDNVNRSIQNLGGSVTNELSIINAIGTQVSTSALAQLAASPLLLLLSVDAPYLNVHTLIPQKTTESANTGIPASQLHWTGSEPVQWQSVNWNAVNWNAIEGVT